MGPNLIMHFQLPKKHWAPAMHISLDFDNPRPNPDSYIQASKGCRLAPQPRSAASFVVGRLDEIDVIPTSPGGWSSSFIPCCLCGGRVDSAYSILLFMFSASPTKSCNLKLVHFYCDDIIHCHGDGDSGWNGRAKIWVEKVACTAFDLTYGYVSSQSKLRLRGSTSS